MDVAVIPGINSGRSLPCIPHALAVPLEPCNHRSRLTHPSRTNRVRVSTLIRRLARSSKGYHPHPAQNLSARPQTPRSTSSDPPLSLETVKGTSPAIKDFARMRAVTMQLRRNQRQNQREVPGASPHYLLRSPLTIHFPGRARIAVVSR